MDVRSLDEWGVCYDLEIEDDHSYLVGSGIIVHNTEVCRELDGKIFKPDDPLLDELRPPRHMNCRSILTPISVDTQVDEDEFITDEQAGLARDLSGEGFKEEVSAKEYGFDPDQPRDDD